MTKFLNLVETANENKESFNSSMESLKGNLQESVKASGSVFVSAPAPKTGWLKGSLSYPWVVVCSIVPSLKDLF